MDVYEAAVGHFLTRNGLAFICSQYDLRVGREQSTGNWSADFVVLDHQNKDAVLVEVSAAETPSSLIQKALDRERLLEKLKDQLVEAGIPMTQEGLGWASPRFIGFIKGSNVKWAYELCDRSAGHASTQVCFVALEDVMLSYAYWEKRSLGLPVRDDLSWKPLLAP